jgi:uncharacterized membrane protein
MTPNRQKRITLCCLIICAMLICLFFSLRHGPHHVAFNLAFDGLFLINFWLGYRYNIKHHRQRDTLIHLFPDSLATPKERS